MKGLLCFFLWSLAAYAISMVTPYFSLYALENWGASAFRSAISLSNYAIMLIGYFAFKPIFEGEK